MTKILLILPLFFYSLARADWAAVVTCENDGFVIDEKKYSCRYGICQSTQVVIRNQRAIHELLKKGAVDKRFINKYNELIVPDIVFNTDSPTAVVTLKRFSKDEYNASGFSFVLGFLNKGPGNTFELKAYNANPYPSARPEIANWIFRDCH